MLINLEKYHRPKSLAEALYLLKDSNGSTVPIAGGTHLVSSNDKRIREVVDITHLIRRFIEFDGNTRIGAMTTLQEIIDSKKLLKPPYDILREACQTTSVSKMIRNVATLGGEIAHGSRYADIITALLVLDTEVDLIGKDTYWATSLSEFIKKDGPMRSELRNQLIVQIRLPAQMEQTGSAFIRLSQIQSSPTIISAATLLAVRDGLCQKARIALGAAGPQPMRINKVESMLEGCALDEAVIEEVSENVQNYIDPFSDARASAEYRKTVSGVLVKRALKTSLERINHRS